MQKKAPQTWENTDQSVRLMSSAYRWLVDKTSLLQKKKKKKFQEKQKAKTCI